MKTKCKNCKYKNDCNIGDGRQFLLNKEVKDENKKI